MKSFDARLTIAIIMTLVGSALLIMGLWMAPSGLIHSSVLVGFGETSTFVAAVLGIDYSYRSVLSKLKLEISSDGEEAN